jgi:EAL domain-containing protein (putative c-di-GMP-specific phosphodiesterase class I)
LCSINLSGVSLADEDFLIFVTAELASTRLPPSKVCFEITETAAIANLSGAMRFIEVLRRVGCRFALDDFGSGLSSFAYLKSLPVDFLKIDGMFVKDIIEDPIDRELVRSINEIGHVMGKRTIAEFVESGEILAALGEIGVDYAQGFELGKPRLLPKR